MIPALSIRQPWAWLIVNGHKDIENRDWRTPFRGRFLVHASKTITRRYYEECCAMAHEMRDRSTPVNDLPFLQPIPFPAFEDLQLGGIVGESTVIDCVQDHPSQWKHPESWGFVLSDSRPLPFIPLKGRLGFFNVPNEAIAP